MWHFGVSGLPRATCVSRPCHKVKALKGCISCNSCLCRFKWRTRAGSPWTLSPRHGRKKSRSKNNEWDRKSCRDAFCASGGTTADITLISFALFPHETQARVCRASAIQAGYGKGLMTASLWPNPAVLLRGHCTLWIHCKRAEWFGKIISL